MSFDNLLTLLIIGGLGYMMFRGGGCCGSHGSHKGNHDESDETGNRDVEKRSTDR
jgi:hypothetical protein